MVQNLYTHQDSNVRKTWLLMTAVFVLLVGIGFLFSRAYGDSRILYIFAAVSVSGNVFAYWYSDKVALAMSGARQLGREGNERLFRIVENLAITAGLPLPRLYLIPGQQINAFATGRNAEHAAVAVTQGALERLDDNELTGVLAHELSHIGNRDILISTIVVVLAGIIAILSDWFLRMNIWGGRSRDNDRGGNAIVFVVAIIAAILAPLAATLIRLAVSRKREFLADASGALLTRYPEGLASALQKIFQDDTPLRNAHTATAHLFLANPLKGRERTSWVAKLFMTHPPVQERIKALTEMSPQ